MSSWFEDEYRRRMKNMGYEPTMDGMDDQDIKDALEAMDRRNAARQQDEWQYPRYKPVDPGLQARILRMFGQPYDKSAIDPKEAHYLNGGWDDDDEDDATPQAKPAPNLFAPSQGRERQPDKPWTLNWGKNGNMFGAKPPTPGYRPEGNGTMFPSWGVMERLFKYGPGGNGTDGGYQSMSNSEPASYRRDGLQMAYFQQTDENPYAGGYANGGAEGDMLLPGATGLPEKDTPGAMTPSENLFGFITNYEKFEDKPYNPTENDNDSPTIGFGHKIRPGEDFSNGISEKEAWKLLRKDVQEHADAINRWAAENNLKLTQQQFDALVSLRFNLGSLEGAPKLRSLIISGTATPEQIRKEFEDIISDGVKRHEGLWQRRRDEADMFFNNDYRRKELPPPQELFPNS